MKRTEKMSTWVKPFETCSCFRTLFSLRNPVCCSTHGHSANLLRLILGISLTSQKQPKICLQMLLSLRIRSGPQRVSYQRYNWPRLHKWTGWCKQFDKFSPAGSTLPKTKPNKLRLFKSLHKLVQRKRIHQLTTQEITWVVSTCFWFTCGVWACRLQNRYSLGFLFSPPLL